MEKAELKKDLVLLQPEMAPLLPAHISPQKVQRIVLTEVQKNPAIMKCSKGSILQSVMEACSMGLVPNSIEGLAYLVPYGNKCQLQPGYKGLMKLAMQSGHFSKIWSVPVYENDHHFKIIAGSDNPRIEHVPNVDAVDHGKLIGCYACAKIKGEDDTYHEYMSRAAIDRIKARSKSGSSGPWKTDYEEMARKTVLRRLLKSLPTGNEKLETAVNKAEAGGSGFAFDLDSKEWEYVHGTETEEDNSADELNEKFSGKNLGPEKLEKSEKSPNEKSEKSNKQIPLIVGDGSGQVAKDVTVEA